MIHTFQLKRATSNYIGFSSLPIIILRKTTFYIARDVLNSFLGAEHPFYPILLEKIDFVTTRLRAVTRVRETIEYCLQMKCFKNERENKITKQID